MVRKSWFKNIKSQINLRRCFPELSETPEAASKKVSKVKERSLVMNKRITSLALVFVMVLSMLATAVPAYALSTEAPITVTIEPNVKTASPGDTITYTVYVGPIKRFQSANFTLIIPEGLTYIVGNHIEGLKEILGSDKADYTDSTKTMIVSGGGSYNSDEKTALMTFSCTVDEGTVGKTLQITFEGDEDFSDDEYETYETTYDFNSSNVTITSAPKPAESITLNKSELTLTVGGNETLTATVTPTDTTDTVVWSSESDAVATVDSHGNVNAVGVGETKITATAGEQKATCEVTVEAAPCTHDSKTTVPEKASDCTNKGWDEYQECDDCHALFNTSGAPIAEIPYRDLDPNAHTFGSWIDEVSANCTNTGTKGHKDCTLCHKYFDNTGAEIADLTIPTNDDHDYNMSEWGYKESDGHAHVCTRNPAHHDTVKAHNFGADDTCDICGYVRTHVCANHLTKVEEKLADCTNPGNIEHYKCSCGKLYEDATAAVELTEDQVKRDALGHDWIDATCTEPKTCDRCGETEGTALGHDWEGEWSSNADNHWHACTRCDAKDGEDAHNPGAPATETTPQICTDCGYVIESATGHVCANHLSYVPPVDPDCTNPGNIEHYKCTCNKLYEDDAASVELTEDQVRRGALGHDWPEEWESDATGHWHVCTRDPEHHSTKESHNPGPAATEDTPQTCTECGYVLAPATGHLCVSHLEEVDKVDPTCTETGKKAHYKCSCGKLYWDDDAYDLIEDPSELVIDALDHAWADEWSSDATNHWHACSRCGDQADKEAHVSSGPATATTPETCTVCGHEIAPATSGGSSGGGGSSVSTYAITVKDAKNGDVSANRKSAAKGTTVTLTVTPDKGYELDTIKVLDSKDNAIKLTEKGGKFTFAMPASKVTVEATFKAETPDNPFTDVPEDSYYEDAVIWAVDKGITAGTSATTFSPDDICTRAQAVTFLWRAAGSPEPKTSTMPFTDVKVGSYYYDAVLWAVEQGITAGTSATTFAPDLNCSRAQIVTFLWRAAGSPAISGSPAFSDVASDAYYAKAVKWAQANGITSGIGGGLFGSNDNCTRAQIVTFIYRYMEK